MTPESQIEAAFATMMAAGGLFFLLYVLVMLCGCMFTVAAIGFWIWMIIDCANHQEEDKPLWLIVVIACNWIGALVYYFVCRKKRLAAVRGRV